MKNYYGMLFWILVFGLTIAPAKIRAEQSETPHTAWQIAQAPWDEEAESTFWLGRGMGRQLMTQEEWQEHQQKMRSMSAEERQRYREDWHKKMIERARERGIAMPEAPRSHPNIGPGQGMRPGSGPGTGKRQGGGGR